MDSLIFESVSLLLVHILLKKSRCPWSICGEMEQVEQMAGGGLWIVHCYREANKVADVLSNVGWANQTQGVRVYESFAGLPFLARGAYRLDRLAFPSFPRIRSLSIAPRL